MSTQELQAYIQKHKLNEKTSEERIEIRRSHEEEFQAGIL